MNPTNDDRALWAATACDAFAKATRQDTAGDPMEDIIGDLLCDLMHLCRVQEINFNTLLGRALMNFDEEVEEEENEEKDNEDDPN